MSPFTRSILVLGTIFSLAISSRLVCAQVEAPQEPVTPEQATYFEQQVRPILQEHCFQCHSHAADKAKGDLLLDSRAGLLAGGTSGGAVVPGKPEESLLIKAIGYNDPDYKMPPGGKKLSDEKIATLTGWVKQGAPWPGKGGKAARPRGKITEEDKAWWSFQPVKRYEPPAVKNNDWVRNDIDRFLLARMEREGLAPAPEASKGALVRRLYFDIWGMPPTPAEVAEFVQDDSPAAYERLIDKLLDSPHYGERWARQWLDLVRYADSDGYRLDEYRPNAWRFRDYVIDAFNADKPYDRFVQEQLAGDEMFPDDPQALVATGYLRHWIYEYNSRDARGQWITILNDVTDTTADVFLGVGLQCARCHDHKFDPLLQKDYYRLQAYLAPLMPRDDLTTATAAERRDHAAKLAVWEAKTASLREELAVLEAPYRQKAADSAVFKFPDDIKAMIRKPAAERTPLEHQIAELAYRQVYFEYGRMDKLFKGDDKERILAIKRQLADFDKDKPAPLPLALAVTDVGPSAPQVTIPKRGDENIEPGVLSVLDEQPAAISPLANSTGRRTALAQWLTQPDNPLTARVIVNRVWQNHFGRGLAQHSSDFGKLGELPSHPELLDWLASRFVQDGWSFKRLHRLILTSAAYRQAAIHPDMAAGRLKDPENRLLWRANVHRLDAEQIRDSIFSVTGEMNLAAGGPGVNPTDPRRSIYTKVMRNTRDPLLDAFDAPLWFNSASSRDTTTTPVQSLLLLNGSFMLSRAKALAGRLQREVPGDEAAQIALAYQLAYGREPTAEETAAARKFMAGQRPRVDVELAGSAQAAFVSGKLPYRDGQAAVLTPESAQSRFEAACGEKLPHGDFTIEAFALVRSVYDDGRVRTLAAAGDVPREAGFAFGVTGQRSRRKPQTLVLQFGGKKQDGTFGEEAIFSDQTVQLNKPYYLAASVKLAGDKPGEVAFYVKDLSNDDEPLLTARVPHEIVGGFATKRPLIVGGRAGKTEHAFDGLLDDLRLSEGVLDAGQLLYTVEGVGPRTIAYWQFEPKPDVFQDASPNALHLRSPQAQTKTSERQTALVDFCHVLLNSNEFLYVE